jgi:hypothetical protein
MPPTSPTPWVGRKPPTLVPTTPSWCGSTLPSLETPSPRTWEGAVWIKPVPWLSARAVTSTSLALPVPWTSRKPPAALDLVTAVGLTTPSWRGLSADLRAEAGGGSSSYSYWLPSASHAAGLNNSQWRTDLGILNLASSRNDVQLVFYGSSGQTTQTAYVAAGSQSILVDVVGQMGASGNGALEVRTSLPAIVSSRTYNLNAAGASCYPNGTLGQNLDAFTAAEGLSTGQVGFCRSLPRTASTARTSCSPTRELPRPR